MFLMVFGQMFESYWQKSCKNDISWQDIEHSGFQRTDFPITEKDYCKIKTKNDTIINAWI